MVSLIHTVLLIDQKWPRMMITFPSTNRDYVSEICGSNEFIQYQKQPPEVFYKKLFLKIPQYLQEKPVLESLF